jgi:hypothetical protein
MNLLLAAHYAPDPHFIQRAIEVIVTIAVLTLEANL